MAAIHMTKCGDRYIANHNGSVLVYTEYNEKTQELYAEFADGSTYKYHQVSPWAYKLLRDGENTGRRYNYIIRRKNDYKRIA